MIYFFIDNLEVLFRFNLIKIFVFMIINLYIYKYSYLYVINSLIIFNLKYIKL